MIIDIVDEDDPDTWRNIKLSKLKSIIERWQQKYGTHALLTLDAGHNNISADVEPTKKQAEHSSV